MSAVSRKSVVAFAASMVMAAGGLTVAAGSVSAAEKDEKSQKVSVLFAFDGRQAFMTPVTGSDRTYDFVMPLICTSASQCEEVMWFTDRPERDSDSMSFEDLADLWDGKGKNSFATDPPNIAIVAQNDDSRKAIIAEMRNPRVATTADGGKYFTARVRTEKKNAITQIAKGESALARHAKNPTTTIPNILGPTSVFIDGSNGTLHCMDPLDEFKKVATAEGIHTVQVLECPDSTPMTTRKARYR